MGAKSLKNRASGGRSGLRVGADRVGYRESGNTPGFVRAKRAFLASSHILRVDVGTHEKDLILDGNVQ